LGENIFEGSSRTPTVCQTEPRILPTTEKKPEKTGESGASWASGVQRKNSTSLTFHHVKNKCPTQPKPHWGRPWMGARIVSSPQDRYASMKQSMRAELETNTIGRRKKKEEKFRADCWFGYTAPPPRNETPSLPPTYPRTRPRSKFRTYQPRGSKTKPARMKANYSGRSLYYTAKAVPDTADAKHAKKRGGRPDERNPLANFSSPSSEKYTERSPQLPNPRRMTHHPVTRDVNLERHHRKTKKKISQPKIATSRVS